MINMVFIWDLGPTQVRIHVVRDHLYVCTSAAALGSQACGPDSIGTLRGD